MSVEKHLKNRKSGDAFDDHAERPVAGLEARLSSLAGLAQGVGESLANAGRQGEAAMQGVGLQSEAIGEKLSGEPLDDPNAGKNPAAVA